MPTPWNIWPFTTFHELNLDWLLGKTKDLETRVEALEEGGGGTGGVTDVKVAGVSVVTNHVANITTVPTATNAGHATTADSATTATTATSATTATTATNATNATNAAHATTADTATTANTATTATTATNATNAAHATDADSAALAEQAETLEGISGAIVGEYAKIAAVDANGVPTAWTHGTPGGTGTTDFDLLTNRPFYNGTGMTHNTNIPEVKTAVWDAKYNLPATGIPASDLSTAVQSTLAEVTEKADKRTVKTAMDAVATVNTDYFLGSQNSVAVTLPDSPATGDYITVVFYTGETATPSLSITGDTIGEIPLPDLNQRIEISILYDGTHWAILSNTMEAV